MRQGFRVIDADTRVNPSLDVLLRYADQDLRDRMDDLRPYTRTVKPRPGQGDAQDMDAYTILSIKPLRWDNSHHGPLCGPNLGRPIEYAQMGRVFCSIDVSEGVAMTKAVIDLMGDQALMFASDYPHPEIIFPDHADTVIGWRHVLGEQPMHRLMWENAARFLRLTSTPWGDDRAEAKARHTGTSSSLTTPLAPPKA